MLRKTHILATSTLLASALFTTVTSAKSYYPSAAPATYHVGGTLAGVNMISCSTCHSSSPETENNVTTSFGIAFGQRSDDDFGGSLLNAYNSLAPLDSDGDGFSNQQEAFAGSLLNYNTSTPALTGTGVVTSGNISAKPYVGIMAASDVSLTPLTGINILGGMVSFTAQNNPAFPAQATATFMFKDGGAQTGATIQFYNKDGTPNTSINATDSSFIANVSNGSVDVGIKDEGVFDLYSTAVFQQEAIAKYNNSPIAIGTAANVPVTATIDPYAKVSSLAIIEPYAQIDAYAVVDDYAVVGAYAQVGSYAYIAASIDIYTGIDIYTNVIVDAYASVDTYVTVPTRITAKDGTGYVSGKFSVTTTTPTPLLLGAAATAGESGTTGGLHCMTTGLGTQGLMFLGLLGTAFLVRRKLN